MHECLILDRLGGRGRNAEQARGIRSPASSSMGLPTALHIRDKAGLLRRGRARLKWLQREISSRSRGEAAHMAK